MGLGVCCVRCVKDNLSSSAYWILSAVVFVIKYCLDFCVYSIGGF